MRESDTRQLVLNGTETEAVRGALDHYDADDAESLDDVASRFDADLGDGDRETVELTRANARVVLGALEERERVAAAREAERLAAIRERFAETFDFEDRGPDSLDPVEDEEFPGST